MNIYCKDDLPTWHEMYHEFWNEQLFYFDPEEYNELNLYWKTEHSRMIIGFACNQLNKMISENKDQLLEFIRNNFNDFNIKNFYFILSNDIEICEDGSPSIYSLKIPSTKQFSIFSSNHKRKDLSEINKKVELKLIVVKEPYDFQIISIDNPKFKEILNKIMIPIIDYFTEPIGWK